MDQRCVANLPAGAFPGNRGTRSPSRCSRSGLPEFRSQPRERRDHQPADVPPPKPSHIVLFALYALFAVKSNAAIGCA